MAITCKLLQHDKNFSADDVIIFKDYPGLSLGDIVEVYHEDGDYSRLLLKVKQINNEGTGQQKGSISIISSLVTSFHLRQYHNVVVNKVNKDDVTLSMLEIIYKDNFMTRGDSWRLHRSLIGSCCYISQKSNFLDIRSSINELWMGVDKVACGVVGETTKVVYRSASAIFHIFVQMSAEMWEFDYTGDLFFEKAIMYFLKDLFNNWKDNENSCNHQVVIVLFSRTYYTAISKEELSPEIQNEVSCSHDGRFYQDFYKVIRQCEKHDNLQNVILDLKSSFHGYPLYVGCKQPFSEDKTNPKGIGINSRANEGNILQAINLSLNVFEKNYINCNLEETNCTTLIITPSSGVFEVDEELTALTRNRLIDNGVGIDLVCLGEQPLHAVPLIKFISSKSKNSSEDTYNVPQWINLSYYSKPNSKSSVFVPRMTVPEKPQPEEIYLQRCSPMFGEVLDYDEYDRRVFEYSKPKLKSTTMQSNRSSFANPTSSHQLSNYITSTGSSGASGFNSHQQQQHSSMNYSPEMSKSFTGLTKKHSLQDDNRILLLRSVSEEPGKPRSFDASSDLKFTMESDKEESTEQIVSLTRDGSDNNNTTTPTSSATSSSTILANNNKFNPFKPQDMETAITLFKHRWLHIASSASTNVNSCDSEESDCREYIDELGSAASFSKTSSVEEASFALNETSRAKLDISTEENVDDEVGSARKQTLDVGSEENEITLLSSERLSSCPSSCLSPNSTLKLDSLSRVSAATGKATWTGTLKGVDWKSLCFPACLPLTIHYFPDHKALSNQYAAYNYNIVIDDDDDDFVTEPSTVGVSNRSTLKENRFDHTELPPEEKFMEMVTQRISRGFQFVIDPASIGILKLSDTSLHSMEFDPKRSYVLSIGTTIHVLRMLGRQIHVDRYTIRDPFIPKPLTYRYNMWPYNCLQYSKGCTKFSYESPNNFAWNSVDRYICDSGKDDEMRNIQENMKYWRSRFLLLPVKSTPLNPSVKEDKNQMLKIEGFLHFLENVNKIRRVYTSRPLFQTRGAKNSNERTPERAERKESKTSLSSIDKRTSPIQIECLDNTPSNKDNSNSSAPRSSLTTPTSTSSAAKHAPMDMPPEHFLSIHSPLQDIAKAMKSPEYGLTFIPKQDNLCEYTFISAEAVAWMMKSIDECKTKKDAVVLGQALLEAKLILHASESSRQTFVDGFFLYFMKQERKEEESKKRRFLFNQKQSEDEMLDLYNIKWIEVALWRDKYQPDKFLQKDLPYDITHKVKKVPDGAVFSAESVPLYKKMEYNPDVNQKSGRSEWCVIAYNGNYHPNLAAYALEINWLVASGPIIADMVQKWSHRASSYGFHLVPAPMCIFPKHSLRCSRDPFRKNPFIPLNLECLLKPGQGHLFDDFDSKTWARRMIYFQEAILYKFDFLREIPQTGAELSKYSSCKSFQFIHVSGSILVKINDMLFQKDADSPTLDQEGVFKSPFAKRLTKKFNVDSDDDQFKIDLEYKNDVGFFWVYNYALTKKWRSSATGSVPDARKYMRETFSGFCSNKDNQLVEFWNSICLDFEKKEKKRLKEQEEQDEIKRQIQEEIDSIPTAEGSTNVTHF